jgi:hypothetical protein
MAACDQASHRGRPAIPRFVVSTIAPLLAPAPKSVVAAGPGRTSTRSISSGSKSSKRDAGVSDDSAPSSSGVLTGSPSTMSSGSGDPTIVVVPRTRTREPLDGSPP